jgi:hypothetical protein
MRELHIKPLGGFALQHEPEPARVADGGRAVEALEDGDHVVGTVDEVGAETVVLRAGKDRDEAAEFIVEARPGGEEVGSAVVAGGHRIRNVGMHGRDP